MPFRARGTSLVVCVQIKSHDNFGGHILKVLCEGKCPCPEEEPQGGPQGGPREEPVRRRRWYQYQLPEEYNLRQRRYQF